VKEMKSWDDVKRTISSIPEEELTAISFAATLVAKIIIKRKDLGWTQAELANAAGLKQSAVARIESGNTIPRIDTIQKLAKAVGLKLDLVIDEQAATATA
jgi:ribosome-binding protein aMBF1 (putative translation factor)